jgi:EAL domain-containing protein (putative c-di-GMP-specific phosphodiesterase class I)
VSTLEDLKSLGINISIDDFGIGYSSYLNLKKLPIDKIKIAKDFVKGLNKNMEDDVIVDSIIFMSKNLKLEIIAEGVETQEQLDYLTSKKCDLIQGYYYYKPIPDSEITQILGIE